MSDIGQIQEALTRLFGSEAQRIVFWNDPDREFVDMLPELTLGDVTTLMDPTVVNAIAGLMSESSADEE